LQTTGLKLNGALLCSQQEARHSLLTRVPLAGRAAAGESLERVSGDPMGGDPGSGESPVIKLASGDELGVVRLPLGAPAAAKSSRG
jgi:hypothetical protein